MTRAGRVTLVSHVGAGDRRHGPPGAVEVLEAVDGKADRVVRRDVCRARCRTRLDAATSASPSASTSCSPHSRTPGPSGTTFGMSAWRVVTIGVPIACASSRIVGAPPSESPSAAVALGWMRTDARASRRIRSRVRLRAGELHDAPMRPAWSTSPRAAASSGPSPTMVIRAAGTRARARSNAAIASSSPFFSTNRPANSTVDESSGAQRGILVQVDGNRLNDGPVGGRAGGDDLLAHLRAFGQEQLAIAKEPRRTGRATAAGTAAPRRQPRTGWSPAGCPSALVMSTRSQPVGPKCACTTSGLMSPSVDSTARRQAIVRWRARPTHRPTSRPSGANAASRARGRGQTETRRRAGAL